MITGIQGAATSSELAAPCLGFWATWHDSGGALYRADGAEMCK